MSVIDDGVIKFDVKDFFKTESLKELEYSDLENWRKTLYSLNLIGEYPKDRIGFGNLSIRENYQQIRKTNFPQFLITGTQTGRYKDLTGNHYTKIIDGSIEKLKISCHGPILASSESLTHAAVYLCSPKINSIFHIHHNHIWNSMLKADYLKTSKETPYGTAEMALEVKNLIKEKTSGEIVMAGHLDGIIIFGEDLQTTGKKTIALYSKFCS